ncbi:MAG: chromosome segregation protein SMC [Syntrophales bacterium]|nr:chromosome segregation protein SMC [Syntrophales bacterium]
MQIKRLEIAGFKSFRDRVVFEFLPGITAIVGPNGCGKSNVVDALRWAMGEQQVRYIRGRKIDDVIFHGSDEASAVSLAEVTIILARSEDLPFPEPYEKLEEISISRKLFRDGESEYYINNIPCRLLDIREFFMGTGVGARTYSIIEQNSISHLIEAKPEERRVFLEEAAGISKYKSRKEAAAKKIESTKQNLSRLNDIIKEVKGQLNTLSRQAKKAEEFRNLKNTLKKGEVTLAVHAYRSLKLAEEEKQALINFLKRDLLQEEARLSASEAQIANIREKMTIAEEENLRLQEKVYQNRNDIQLLEQKLQYLRNQLKDIQERISQNENLLVEIEIQRKKWEERQKTLFSKLEDIRTAEEEHRTSFTELEAELRHLRDEENQSLTEMEQLRSQLVTLAAEKARAKNEENALQRILDTMAKQKERDEQELSRNKDILGEISKKISELDANIVLAEETIKTIQLEIGKTKQEEERLRNKLKSLDRDISALKETLSSKTTRLNSLKEFHESYAWCNGTTQAIMTSWKKDLPGLVALVADCLTVQKGYERAVESVLGEKLQYIIVRSWEDGLEAIGYLKKASLGRGHFIPLEFKPENGDISYKNLPFEMEPLIKHVSARADFVPIVRTLLQDTFIVSDIKEATKFWSNNGFKGTLVTFEGDIIFPHGVLSGGSPNEGEKSIFRDKNEMSQLEAEISQLTASLREAHSTHEMTLATLNTCLEKIKELTEKSHQTELQLNSKKKDRERFLEEQKRIEQTLKTIEYNLKARIIEEEETQKKKHFLSQEVLSLAEKEGKISSHMEAWQKKYGTAKLRRAKIEEEITQRRVVLAAIGEKREFLLNEKKRLEEEIKSLIAKEAQLLTEKKEGEEKFDNLARKQKELEKNISDLYLCLKSLEEELSTKRNEKEELTQHLKYWEECASEARKKLEEIRQQYQVAREELHDIHYRLESLNHHVQEKYSVFLDNLCHDFPPISLEEVRMWEEKITSTRMALENFGEVNLLAIDEFNTLKERYDFLTTQATDLNQSIQSLQRTISKINRISRERFAQTFHEVNQNFQQLFSRIFPGGRGELILMDENNLLETGVEIEIQLPGKKKQHISLLSGGEKAMVALSFILAFVLNRPIPFLVLDEVDAPLDDTNINLFVTLLKDIAKSSQVIVITHNKITMEAAHYLYGITMEKKGISKVISVSLD